MMKLFYVGVKALIVNDKNEVLLLKDSSKADFWDVPGGRIDDNETIQETLLRELREELPNHQNAQIGQLVNAYRVPGSIKDDLGLTLLFFSAKADFPENIELSDEHEEYVWLSINEALERGSDGVQDALEALRLL